jgi:hypothetical protein
MCKCNMQLSSLVCFLPLGGTARASQCKNGAHVKLSEAVIKRLRPHSCPKKTEVLSNDLTVVDFMAQLWESHGTCDLEETGPAPGHDVLNDTDMYAARSTSMSISDRVDTFLASKSRLLGARRIIQRRVRLSFKGSRLSTF